MPCKRPEACRKKKSRITSLKGEYHRALVPAREVQTETAQEIYLSFSLLPSRFFRMDYANMKIFWVSDLIHTADMVQHKLHCRATPWPDVTGLALTERQTRRQVGLHHEPNIARGWGKSCPAQLKWVLSPLAKPHSNWHEEQRMPSPAETRTITLLSKSSSRWTTLRFDLAMIFLSFSKHVPRV